MIDIARINRLDALSKQRQVLDKEIAELEASEEYTMESLTRMYDCAVRLAREKGWQIGQLRERYMFLALYTYNPSALVRKLRRGGMREDIAKVMGITTNNVSHINRNLLFYYRLYVSFQKEVDELYKAFYDE